MIIATVNVPSRELGGDWYYRSDMPMRRLAREPGVWCVDITLLHRALDQVLRAADVVIVNMVPHRKLVDAAIDRRARGQVTIFELNDDPLAIPEPVSDNERAAWHDIQELLPLFDGVQFSTEELAKRYGKDAACAAVFHNAVEWERRQARPPVMSRASMLGSQLRIGWGGSRRHFDDIRAHAADIAWAVRAHNAVLCLMCSPEIEVLFHPYRPNVEWAAPGSIGDYYRWLATLDIGLAPLLDTPFNRARSDVKFLEYALHGVTAVLPDLVPYDTAIDQLTCWKHRRGTCGVEVSLTAQKHDARQLISANALAYAASREFDPAPRLAWYRRLAGPFDWTLAGRGERLITGLSTFDGSLRVGRYITMGFGEHEVAQWERAARGEPVAL